MRREEGFTIVELMVAIMVFAIATTAFYQLLFSSTRGSERAQSVINVSEEARLGFNRMVRDTREAGEILTPTPTSFRISVDFNGNGDYDNPPTDPTGSYEKLIFAFNPAQSTITVQAVGGATEVLMRGVECIEDPPSGCHDVFTYASSQLQYDSNADGVTSWQEIDDHPLLGINNDTIDPDEAQLLDVVRFALRVRQGDSDANFYAEAQLRNRR